MNIRWFTCFAALTLLIGCNQTGPQGPTAPVSAADETVVVRQSPNDSRAYRYLELSNKLKVLLISDLETTKAAASLSVYRGSFHEPKSRPGLAHFLEHMLFIGTEKYPEVDSFQTYISGNGGSSNAYTALDHTNYFFDIKPDAFEQGLDRFAQFFISPLLSTEYVEREKNAVHSEYQLQIKDDGWRGYMVSKIALNPDHPGSRFTIGSLDTLSGDVEADLRTFFAEHYSADQMGLVVIANQTLDELASWITPLFEQVPNSDIGPNFPAVPMYTTEQLPAKLTSQSFKEGARISYNFPLPSTRPVYRNKPEQYVANLLGHEGEGSLHQALIGRGWIESLSAGINDFDRHNGVLSVSMGLTELGKAHVDEISELLFNYIELIASTPPQEWLYQEQAKVAELGFRFQESAPAQSLVSALSPRLADYPPQDLLVAPFLMERFDANLIEGFLRRLRPDNVFVEYVANDAVTERVEPWFQVPYKLELGAPARQAVPDVALALPKPNPYLPEDLALKSSDEDSISQVIDRPGLKLWLDRDVSFGSPRANLILELGLKDGLFSAKERAMAQLYRALVTDALSELVYPAYLAGLGYSVSVPDSGFEVRVGGYHDKQGELLSAVLDKLTNATLKADRFDTLKTTLIRSWNNFAKERPYNQTLTVLGEDLRSGRWPRPELVAALTPVTLAELQQWRDKRLAAISVQGLVHGNINNNELDALAKTLRKTLPLEDLPLVRPSVKEITAARLIEVPVDHNDSSMVLYVQDDEASLANRAKSAMAGQLLRQPYFTSLRTDQQLGYVVSVSSQSIAKRGGISFIVQSPTVSAAYLEQATLEFMQAFIGNWENLTDAEFAAQKAGLLNRLREKDKNLNERSQRYWSDLVNDELDFDTRERLASEVEALSRDDMQRFVEGLQNKLRTERLLIFSRGQFDEVPNGEVETAAT